jgi:hypothetical protein
MHTSVYPIQMRFNKYANQLQTLVIVSFLLTTSVCKGPFTKDVRADGGGGLGGRGVWKIRTNSDIGGRVFFSNPESEI